MAHESCTCPINATLNLLNQRWNLHIIRALLESNNGRFNELSRTLGINPRTLCARLRELEDEGIVTRVVVSEEPMKVEYQLTEKGQDLNRVVDQLIDWGMRWMDPNAVPCPTDELTRVC
jgi:DNA-binding HxlR family transcriptional regulator